jgi:hypothetical protein
MFKHISYAKGKSDIIAKLDGTFRIREPKDSTAKGTKRSREDDYSDDESD